MTRVRRGYVARRRRTKIRLFASTFIGAHSRLTRTITQQKMRALVSSHRDRGRQKMDFRRLWITRISSSPVPTMHFSDLACTPDQRYLHRVGQDLEKRFSHSFLFSIGP